MPGAQAIPSKRSAGVTPTALASLIAVSMRGSRSPRSNNPISVRCSEARTAVSSWEKPAALRALCRFLPNCSAMFTAAAGRRTESPPRLAPQSRLSIGAGRCT